MSQAVLASSPLAHHPAACSPLSYGAVADGTTDNTRAIQQAINVCAAQGGGTVEFGRVDDHAVYLTGPVTLKSGVWLQIDAAVVLQGTNDHSRYVGAYINWVYRPNEALISAERASNVGIIGTGTIDGAGDRLQSGGGPSWWTLGAGKPSSIRPWLIEFYRCDHITIRGVTLRNSPMWNQAIRYSRDVSESAVTITAPSGSPNTDGVDIVGSTNVTLSNLNISVGDDDIAIKSGLPFDPTDPKQDGLPRIASSNVRVSNITAGGGHGISIGSEAANGVHDVSIENVHYDHTAIGFRIKTARDRGSQIYNISLRDVVMRGVGLPLSINTYYPAPGAPAEPPFQAARSILATTPHVHDVRIENFAATGADSQSIIEGLPGSCVRHVTLREVSIQTSGKGMGLRHVTGAFTDVTSIPADGSPFVVQENVSVSTSGTMPAIPATAPQSGQIACAAQIDPAN